MKKLFLTMSVCGVSVSLLAQDTNILNSEKARVSYAIGMMLGKSWQQQGLDVDPQLAARAIQDVQSSNTTLLTEDQVRETLTTFQQEFRSKQQEKMKELGEKAKSEGDAFLAANKNKPGVQTLPDGLQYIVLTNGTGPLPTAADTVSVNYRGTLIDGTEFDNSYKRGEPTSFPVGGVIPGWTEALEKMPVGSTWKLFIPSELAYGERGNRGIPPNSVLIFEVTLLSAKTPPPPVASQPLTSDIIKVPSAEEMKHGAKIETIKPEDLQKYQSQSQTNH